MRLECIDVIDRLTTPRFSTSVLQPVQDAIIQLYKKLLVTSLKLELPSNKAINLCHDYYQCIYFSLSLKATSLMWP